MKNFFAGTLFLFTLSAGAQNFGWEAKITEVTQNGYVKILLDPAITARLRQGYPDIRLYDHEGHETPYLVYKDEAKQGPERFVAYQVVNTVYNNGCCSRIEVKNSTGKPIDHIVLEVNNADARREMDLSGSYDGVNWFAVRDVFTVESFNGIIKGEKKTTSLIRFDFPLTDYKYYQFRFDDWRYWWRYYSRPVFIVRAGHVEPTFIPEKCLEVPAPSFTQKDSARQTIVRFDFAEAQYTDHFKFEVQQVKNKDYYRSADLYELKENKDKSFTQHYLGSTVLSSINENEMNVPGGKARHYILKINNEDDRPLIVKNIRGLQVKHYLVTELETGNDYILRFGNDSIAAPVYDLQYFKSKIPDSLKVLTTLAPVKITAARQSQIQKAEAKKPEEAKSFFSNKTVIWLAISLVGIVLLLMTVRMVRDMKDKTP